MHQFPASRVLVVEDDPFLGLAVEATLAELGCLVLGPFAAVVPAIQMISTNRLDAAVLDINLGKELSFPIADALVAVSVPFIFLTGYDRTRVPVAHRNRPLLSKPLVPQALVMLLAQVLGV